MKATFALLADRKVHNFVRKLNWEIHRQYRIGLDIARLPPHISLKQPFDVIDLEALESYMSELAGSTSPFEVHLTRVQLIKTKIEDVETGILWLDVQETEQLRDLHLSLNRELAERLGNTQAAFDGKDYHFHMSIAIGGQPWELYQQAFAAIPALPPPLHYTVSELAMFVYSDKASLSVGYMTYKILPLAELKKGRNFYTSSTFEARPERFDR